MSLVEIKNMAIDVDENRLFIIPSFILEKGEVAIIIGQNGSGKSTLIKKLFSNLREDDYSSVSKIDMNEDLIVRVKSKGANIDLSGQSKINEADEYGAFVYIGQEEYFVNKDSVIESLSIQARAAIERTGIRSDCDHKELVREYALKYLSDIYKYDEKYKKAKKEGQTESQLQDTAYRILKKKKTSQCSGGQKKMISVLAGLIRAQALNVDLVVMDEPLNHLDHVNKLAVSKLLSGLLEERHFALIMVSHCLVFDFIKKEITAEYAITEKCLRRLPEEKKVFHNCLETCFDI